jgi:predicted nucleotidyltransferase
MEIKYYQITQEEKDVIIGKLKSMIEKLTGVAFVYLHGSFPNESRFRDIDIALSMNEIPMATLQTELQLETLFSNAVHYPVDVKILNNAPLSFAYNVIKNGTPIFVANENVRVDFVENTLNNYFDFAPFRKLYLKETLGLEV